MYMKPCFFRIIMLLPFFALLGCGGSSSSGNLSSQVGGNLNTLADVAGVYLGAFPRVENCMAEENYIVIDDTGVVTWYDYEGDACGSGLNCYTIMDGPPAFTPGLIRERNAGGLEAKFNPIYFNTSFQNFSFIPAVDYAGISFIIDGGTGVLAGEQPFGTKVTAPSKIDIENQLCN
jgi:hypothetical protein